MADLTDTHTALTDISGTLFRLADRSTVAAVTRELKGDSSHEQLLSLIKKAYETVETARQEAFQILRTQTSAAPRQPWE